MSRMISVDELRALRERNHRTGPISVQVVDVRSASEYAAGHIPCAIHIPMNEICSRLPDLHSDQTLVLVCQRGQRAAATADVLQRRGLEATVLQGGTHAWQSSGAPLVVNARTSWSLERQVRLGAGVLVTLACLLAVAVHPGWLGLAAFVGLGLTFAGLTDICAMGALLARMPWNRPRPAVPFAHKRG
jgi:rhodanese-related sulfurtransferase